jgi:phage replication O-like protein O
MADPAPGVNAPNYTQTPNEIFDLMPDMDQSELRVVLVVCRQTFGWHKQRDRISLSQLIKATGLSRQGVLNGIEKAISRGLLKRKKVGQHPNGRPLHTYELIVKPVDQQPAEMVYSVDHDSQPSRPPIVNPVDQQKKALKKLSKENDNGEAAHDAAPPAPEVQGLPLQERNNRNGTAKEPPSSVAPPPVDHPNIAIYREVCRNKPNLTQQELIAEARMDSEEWRTTCKAWMAKGYSPRNVSGLLDSHTNRTTGRRRAGPEEASVSPLDFTTLTLEQKRAIREGRTGT